MMMNPEHINDPLDHNSLEQVKVGLQESQTFEELFENLRVLEHIPGTRKRYTADELIKEIERVRHGHRTIEFVTRTYGLRDVVLRLLPDDPIYKKNNKTARQ